jgi:hypothetical protein
MIKEEKTVKNIFLMVYHSKRSEESILAVY